VPKGDTMDLLRDYDNYMIRQILKENDEKMANEIREKENILSELKKKYYNIVLDKEFEEFLKEFDKDAAQTENTQESENLDELGRRIEELEKEIEVLKIRYRGYQLFKKKIEGQFYK
jgi:glutamyl-tRNA reductase